MTTIEWTDRTWNPLRGCSRVSEGCRNCYAERVAARFSRPGQPFDGFAISRGNGPRWTGKVELVEHKLRGPLSWRKPCRVFVNSMSDLFHESLPDRDLDRVFLVMEQAHRHTYQVLTKRPERMLVYMTERFGARGVRAPDPPPNVWLGVSAEDQCAADERIPQLLRTPAAVRFISAEPLLGPIDLRPWLAGSPSLDWVIVGGESGPGARGCHLGWVRSIVQECRAAGVPVFVKQIGETTRAARHNRSCFAPGRAACRLYGPRTCACGSFQERTTDDLRLRRTG